MYNPENENRLLLPDISDRLEDYVGISRDADDTKIKAASLIASDLDIAFVITEENFQRCYEDDENYSEELFNLVVPALCFFTYSRLVELFQANYTDSGLATEEGTLSNDEVKAASKRYRSVGEAYLQKVVKWLADEDSNTDATMDKSILRIRSFGGNERTSPGSGQVGFWPYYNTWKDRANNYWREC